MTDKLAVLWSLLERPEDLPMFLQPPAAAPPAEPDPEPAFEMPEQPMPTEPPDFMAPMPHPEIMNNLAKPDWMIAAGQIEGDDQIHWGVWLP